MKVKAWAGVCSAACWNATEKRCRCRCKGRYHGGKNHERLDGFLGEGEVKEVNERP